MKKLCTGCLDNLDNLDGLERQRHRRTTHGEVCDGCKRMETEKSRPTASAAP